MKTKSLLPLIASALLLAACAPHHVAKPTAAARQVRQNAENKPIPSVRACAPADTTCRTL